MEPRLDICYRLHKHTNIYPSCVESGKFRQNQSMASTAMIRPWWINVPICTEQNSHAIILDKMIEHLIPYDYRYVWTEFLNFEINDYV